MNEPVSAEMDRVSKFLFTELREGLFRSRSDAIFVTTGSKVWNILGQLNCPSFHT